MNFVRQFLNLLNPPDTYCPVCGCKHVSFAPLPKSYRENAELYGYEHFGRGEMIALESYSCRKCGASDRERLYAWWLRKQIETSKLKKGAKFIHFAPEAALSRMIREMHYFDYKTADLFMEGMDFREDLTAMTFADESFDFFICSHVLEHIEDDARAIRELARITKKGGCGILMAPICLDLEHTHEDPAITTEEGRWRHFGQNDHVRLYAHNDYVEKIRANGFQLDELGLQHFGESVFHELGLTSTSILYIARKS